MCFPPKSEFRRNVWSWPGAEYWKSSTLGPSPQRTCWMCSTTAAGSTSSTSPTPENGPKASGEVQPRTSSNQATASATFGTVIPTWSMPSSPGTLVTVDVVPFRFGDHSGRPGSRS